MTSATDLRGGSVRSAGGLTGGSRVFCYNAARGPGGARSTTSTADLRGGSSMRSAGSNLRAGGLTSDSCVFCHDTAGDMRSAGDVRSAGGVRDGCCMGSGGSPRP